MGWARCRVRALCNSAFVGRLIPAADLVPSIHLPTKKIGGQKANTDDVIVRRVSCVCRTTPRSPLGDTTQTRQRSPRLWIHPLPLLLTTLQNMYHNTLSHSLAGGSVCLCPPSPPFMASHLRHDQENTMQATTFFMCRGPLHGVWLNNTGGTGTRHKPTPTFGGQMPLSTKKKTDT